MKTKKIIRWCIITVYIMITLIFSENNSASDGFTIIGQPFTFYKYTAGKLVNRAEYDKYGFYTLYFILDILLVVLLIWLVERIYLLFRSCFICNF